MKNVRADFPILAEGNLVYLDSASSAQKPEAVLKTMQDFYAHSYANVHRGVYRLSEEATEKFESARKQVCNFINAGSDREIIFTKGTTEGINLVASTYGRMNIKKGDEIVVSVLEHHANFVPWQMLAKEKGAALKVVRLTKEEDFDLDHYVSQLSDRTKLVCISHRANGLGIEPPVSEIISCARKCGAKVLLDSAQSVPHVAIDVKSLDVDFLVFSGHKLYGPTGIGVLYGRESLLDAMPPFLYGGEMIKKVSIAETTFNDLPYKFEAGTPPIAEAVGLSAALSYLENIGFDTIIKHETKLTQKLVSALENINGVRILGKIGKHKGLVCFTLKGIHPHDLAQFLDTKGIAVRAGHHCAQPLLTELGIDASTRASIGVYNTEDEIPVLAESLIEARKFFRV